MIVDVRVVVDVRNVGDIRDVRIGNVHAIEISAAHPVPRDVWFAVT
jgi:hypothetical protein